MAAGAGDPYFVLSASAGRALRQLAWDGDPGRRCDPWVYRATTALRILAPDGKRASVPLPFRLDTAAFLSSLPESWLEHRAGGLRRLLGPLSQPVSALTIAGAATGRVASDVAVRFADHLATYRFDFFVTAGLNGRDYGLLSLRDVVKHFVVEPAGDLRFGENDEPIVLPRLWLRPRAGGQQRVCYRCPRCGTEAWGRPGFHLLCGDCNQVLVNTPLA